MAKKKIFVVLGTRPEAIKLAPVILSARNSGWADAIVCNTGQHREMSSEVLNMFGIAPDVDLDIMKAGQTLSDVNSSVLTKIAGPLDAMKPDWVVVQGDTTTTFSAALAAFYQRVPVAHVEAGLRTGNIYSPWPEEMNRRMVSEIASLHFPPTEDARANLVREGISSAQIAVTGNTGIDALKILVRRLETDDALRASAEAVLVSNGVKLDDRPKVLITGHRRESLGKGFEAICDAIASLAAKHPDHDFIYPVHPNPSVRETVYRRLRDGSKSNILLIEPLSYLPFVHLMSHCSLILTDSGGVQEEAPSLGKRVVVLREVTERMEGLSSGFVKLAGTETDRIVALASDALSGRWAVPDGGRDIYGDGGASLKILDFIRRYGTADDQ
ncbi:MAG: UDP-N-acetylglucosamine 2-epimerase (non-hydrolyzing) [Oxalobacteraceae bacterium]|nr:MAG: UDP-N-acetylglucosamine 2-epimerase (non-hydrolyzing) [Oxalobacteraceae bacterium]